MHTICNVNDEPAARYLISRILRQGGFEVVEAATGSEALDVSHAVHPSLIVLDIKLPDMNGHEVCRRLKADVSTASVPVLQVSATYVQDDDRVRGLEGGADAYLTAPVNPTLFLATVRALLRVHDAEQERQQVLEQLAMEKARFEAVLQQMPAGVVIAEAPTGKLVLGNHQLEQIWRQPFASAAEFERCINGNTFHADGQPYRPEEWPLARALRSGEVVGDEEVAFVRGDGTRGVMRISAGPIRDPKGGIVAAVATFHDISERKRIEAERDQLLVRAEVAREAAERANESKDELLAVVSHDLRSPLNATLTWVHLLRTGNLDEQARAKAIESIERSTRLQAHLIEDLLDVARIASGTLRLNVQRADLIPLIRAAIDVVHTIADEKQITIASDLDAGAALVDGDPHRLQQVLWNLLSNAVKFTPAGGHIDVRLARVDGRAEIRVHDTGEGISPEFLPHIFERFRQAEDSTTKRTSGLGLGLTIVRQLIEAHGGVVRAESPGRGQGATFIVQLPLLERGP